jgi:hypothetical protein
MNRPDLNNQNKSSQNSKRESSLEPASSGDSLFVKVAEACRLREGPAGVEQFLQVIARRSPKDLKSLCRELNLPLPVAAALRRELEKRGILDRSQGLQLTETGKQAAGDLAQLPSLLEPCAACDTLGWSMPEQVQQELLPVIREICSQRPQVDVTLDQALATPETNLRRIAFLFENLPVTTRRLLFLGDDDWTSVCLAVALNALKKEYPRNFSIQVFDIDSRIVSALNEWADSQKAPLKAEIMDLRQIEHTRGLEKADAVFTDPPYTKNGLDLFTGWGRNLLERGSPFFLCYPMRDPNGQFQVEGIWRRWGFTLRQLRLGWNQYEGNTMHAGQSALYWLVAAGEPEVELFDVELESGFYTQDSRKQPARQYQCQGCSRQWTIGPGCRWETIQELKVHGCPGCSGSRFRRIRG